MIWKNRKGSDNIEDRRGSVVRGSGKSIGLGTIVLVLASLYFGIDPSIALNMASGGSEPTQRQAPARQSAAESEHAQFISVILADTERVWQREFKRLGRSYQEPKLVLFRGAVRSGCGQASAQVGPFYCPADRKVYIDLSFFDTLKRRHNAPGDFAQAYVVAHEIGHHVQNLLGISTKVHHKQQRSGKKEGNMLSVRLELQADCLAGVWGNGVKEHLERGDIKEALNAANAIGDDTLQKQGQGYVVPDSFTHGTSAQRIKWFQRGFDSGDINSCDTFVGVKF